MSEPEVDEGATEKYTPLLQALLPQGLAWTRDPAALLTKLLSGLGATFDRVDRQALQLIEEADPRTTSDLLVDWERVAGLPGVDPVPGTLGGRRLALVARLVARGRQDEAYFVELAASLGYSATIERFRPFVAGSLVGDSLTQGTWVFVWDVVTSTGDTDSQLESLIRRNAPAHTLVRFRYS